METKREVFEEAQAIFPMFTKIGTGITANISTFLA